MKKILLFLMILCLFLTAGCRPEQPIDDIDSNPAAGRQPTTIQPEDTDTDPTPSDPDDGANQTLPADKDVTPSGNSVELTKDFPRKEIGYVMDEGFPAAAADFGLRLIRHTAQDGKNVLLSPMSAMFALGMSAGGAENNTYVEMEQTLLGKHSDVPLHHSLAAFGQQIGNGKHLHLANSIWLRNQKLTVEKNFLQNSVDYYGSQIYSAPFDESTVSDVNLWVKLHTKEMIPEILNEKPDKDTMMYLINALSFEDNWSTPFLEKNIKEGTFTAAGGQKQKVEMMSATRQSYLENQLATGCKLYYENTGYAFVALLPNSGTPEQLLTALDGENWQTLLKPLNGHFAHLTLPKFKTEAFFSLKEPLQAMGMRDAFDPDRADFSALGHAEGDPLYISAVLQKTVFELDENGTKAAAVTLVSKNAATAAPTAPKYHDVILNRPFVYAIVDRDNIPLFLGIANSIK